MDFEYEFELDVPREYAFQRFSDIQEISSTLPANIVLRPEKGAYELSEGSTWVVKAQRSGRNFVIRNTVMKNQPPEILEFESTSNRIESLISMEFIKTGAESCQVKCSFDITPKGLLGRILLQSIKASKSRIINAMNSGSARLRETIEADYRSA